MSIPNRNRYTGKRKSPFITVTCPECMTPREARRDSARNLRVNHGIGIFKLCPSCSGKKRQAKQTFVLKGKMVPCLRCGTEFYQFPGQPDHKYCSKECGKTANRRRPVEIRECQQCHQKFRHTPKPRSNTPGKFCSLLCRNASYRVQTEDLSPGYRRGWREVRNRYLAAGHRSCASCGVRDGSNHVHHVEPYRLNKNNDFANLVTLCAACHGPAEILSRWIADLSPEERPPAVMAAFHVIEGGIKGRPDPCGYAKSLVPLYAAQQKPPDEPFALTGVPISGKKGRKKNAARTARTRLAGEPETYPLFGPDQ